MNSKSEIVQVPYLFIISSITISLTHMTYVVSKLPWLYRVIASYLSCFIPFDMEPRHSHLPSGNLEGMGNTYMLRVNGAHG